MARMPEPANKRLYAKVKKEADQKFAKHGAYKSAFVVREYKKRGGTYNGKKQPNQGLTKWFGDHWVDLCQPVRKNSKIVGYRQCGRTDAKINGLYPTCRPIKVVEKMTQAQIKQAIAEKQKKMRK